MRTNTPIYRLTSFAALIALLAPPVLSAPAWSQTAPPPPAGAPAPDDQTQSDPPTRVGRLAQVQGTVSFHTLADTQWSPATVNYPVTSGNSFWTEPGARADLEFGNSQITLAPSTELDLGTLDPTGVAATIPQGEAYVHVRALAQGETLTVQTPRGTAQITAQGDYGFAAGDTQTPTTITVINGAAQVTGATAPLALGHGQSATITGTDSFQGTVGPAAPDPFLAAMVPRAPSPPARVSAVAPPPQVAALPGGQDLTTTGTWAPAPDYGPVWYPPVAAGWVPYREGHWAYIPPWGWTWVDDAPWGFAPFHYGRWVFIGGRWGWVPGFDDAIGYPIYAPALVTFFGLGLGVGFAIGGSIGWCPLGPGEVYHPWYHASDRYYRGVNPHIANVTRATNGANVTINTYHNGRFATVVAPTAMTSSRSVSRSVQPVTAEQLATTHPALGHDPVRPTTATAGVTPGVARQLNVAASPGTAPRTAPGPAVRPAAAAVPLRPAPAAVPAVSRPSGPTPATTPSGAPRPAFQPRSSATPATPAIRPAQTQSTSQRPAEAPRPATTPTVIHPTEAPRAPTPSAPRPAETFHPSSQAATPRPAPSPAPAFHPAPESHPAPTPHPAPAQREEKKPGEK